MVCLLFGCLFFLVYGSCDWFMYCLLRLLYCVSLLGFWMFTVVLLWGLVVNSVVWVGDTFNYCFLGYIYWLTVVLVVSVLLNILLLIVVFLLLAFVLCCLLLFDLVVLRKGCADDFSLLVYVNWFAVFDFV